MAKEESSKVVLERTYTIPLSRELLKVPAYKKAKKAVRTVQAFIRKHMKAEKVLVGQHLNMKLWEHGIKNPPKNIKVTTTKDDKGVVRVELFGAPKEEPKKESKVKPAKKIVEAEAKPLEEAVAGAERPRFPGRRRCLLVVVHRVPPLPRGVVYLSAYTSGNSRNSTLSR